MMKAGAGVRGTPPIPQPLPPSGTGGESAGASASGRDPRSTWAGLIVRTAMICLTIAILGAVALWLFFERFGRVAAELGARQAVATLPQAIRPPRVSQLLVQVSTDGLTLRPIPIEIGSAATPRSEQMALVVEQVLQSAATWLTPQRDTLPFSLRALFEVNGIVVVDLSREEAAEGLDFRAECLLAYSIVNSLVDNFDDILAVQFLVDGRPAETLAGALDISAPLVPNAALRGTL